MFTTFEEASKITLGFEGGFADFPEDRGHATMHGVTTAVYNRWRDFKGLPRRSVREISNTEVWDIYHEWYWLEGRCEKLPRNLALVHFDSCIHNGPKQASRFLQGAISVKVDGAIGPKTVLAGWAVNDKVAALAHVDARGRFNDDIVRRRPSQKRFARGWSNRLAKLRRLVK